MVVVELIDTGELLDIIDAKITYVKQVSDIGDVTSLNSSYSWTMKFPKSPNNSIAFDSLGVKNSTSDFPYRKNYVNVYDNGIVIVRKGLISIKETAEEYKGYIQEGIIDFIKSLGSDKIGEVINLSELDHQNDVTTIIDSFDRTDYKYIVANYNGQPLQNNLGITNLSPIGMIPSINVKYLFDKIMAYYGWTYTGDFDFNGLWMTYPTASGYTDAGAELLGITSQYVRGNGYGISDTKNMNSIPFTYKDTTPGKTEYKLGTQDTEYRVLQTGNYKIIFNVKGEARVRNGFRAFKTKLLVNGAIAVEGAKSHDLTETEVILPLMSGDVIRLVADRDRRYKGDFMGFVYVTEANLSVYQVGVDDISFTKALIKYKVKDFFKELMIRGALTSFPDIDRNNLHFINLDNRLTANVVDFSDKFINRTNETYLYESYAQNNYVKHQYDEEGDDYDNGNLIVDNENLDIEKELYKGHSYAPLRDLVPYDGLNGKYFVNNFKMFDVEIKEDETTGDLLASYKPLENRFYFMETEMRNDRIYILGEEVNGFPVAKLNNVSYRDIVADKYAKINQLIERTKIHHIELALSSFDVATLDLKKVYYFNQENAYYLINKVTYVSEEISKGEFILISKN